MIFSSFFKYLMINTWNLSTNKIIILLLFIDH